MSFVTLLLIAGCFASIFRGCNGSTAANAAETADRTMAPVHNRPSNSLTLPPWGSVATLVTYLLSFRSLAW